jgi:hypothetical protein
LIAGYIGSETGVYRLRLEFIADGNQPTVLVCDMVSLVVNIHEGG